MYPYFFPSYFSPKKPAGAPPVSPTPTVPGMEPTGMGNAGFVGMGQTGMPMGPTGMGAGMDETTIPGPVPGTTAGMPSGPVAPPPPTIQPPPVDFTQEQGPAVTSDINYTQAFLKTQVGKMARVEFLIGTNLLTDRTGVIVDVGISYILLRLQQTDDIMLGDIYSIKFVTFLQ